MLDGGKVEQLEPLRPVDRAHKLGWPYNNGKIEQRASNARDTDSVNPVEFVGLLPSGPMDLETAHSGTPAWNRDRDWTRCAPKTPKVACGAMAERGIRSAGENRRQIATSQRDRSMPDGVDPPLQWM
jgi:hypothetical protein